jgi:hypothetical protein
MLLAFFHTPRLHSQDDAAKKESASNLKKLAIGMRHFQDTYGGFPPIRNTVKDGKLLFSWRVEILPFIDEDNLFAQFKKDEPWDSAHNKKLLDKMPKVFAPVTGNPNEKNMTHYQMITGGGALLDGVKKVSLKDVTDGASNTIMIAEAAEPVLWTKPDDLIYDPKKPLPKFGGLFKDGFHAAFADASVHFIKNEIDQKSLRAYITRADDDQPTQEVLSPRERSASNLRALFDAIMTYETLNEDKMPPSALYSKDGKPLLSWRVLILPYLENNKRTALHKQFKLDEPWDSEHNKKLLDQMPPEFAPVAGEFRGKSVTYYQALVGKGTAFQDKTTPQFQSQIGKILVVEAAEPVPWTKPADLPYTSDKPLPKLGGLFEDGFNVVIAIGEPFTDRSVRFIKKNEDEKRLRALIIGAASKKGGSKKP